MKTLSTEISRSMRNLYFVRTLAQLTWAGLVLSENAHTRFTAVLLILYPLWDVACTLYDLKTSGQEGSSRPSQVLNAVLGSITVVAMALTVFTQPTYSIAAFGAWALVAGLLQLASGLSRRRELGGQWPMILSGAQSTLAGVAFVLGGLSGKVHAKDLGGYAAFGAIYFLVGGILLSRRLSQTHSVDDRP
ncbi:MAG TPA: DUF308 domain-containing protein [Edaphobacter sp.]|nr:DUF308 domain-containing protein [Edaphobacter sp.]